MKKFKFIAFLILIVILQNFTVGIISKIYTTKLSDETQTTDKYATTTTQVGDSYVAVSTQMELLNAWNTYDGNSNLHIVLKNDIVIDRTYAVQSNWKIYFSSEGNNMYSLISDRNTGSTVFYVYQNAYLELQNIIVNGNYASSNNSTSCICNFGTVSLRGAVVANSNGNGIFQGAGTLTLEKNYYSTIYNSTENGIGIVGGTVYINSGEIYNNKNGITLIGGNLEINYGTISNNKVYGIQAQANFTFNGGYILDKVYLSNDVVIEMNDITSLNLKLNQYTEGRRVIHSNNSGLIQSISDKLIIDEEGWKGTPNGQNYIALSKKKFNVGGNLQNCNLSNTNNCVYGEDYYTELLATLSTTNTNTRKARIAILGDSISTYEGFTPYTGLGRSYYPYNDPPERNISVNDTWWMQLINNKNIELGVNNSWGGTAVSEVTLGTSTKNSCFLSDERINSLDDRGAPDYIFVFGGMNDMLNMNSGSIQLGSLNDLNRTDTFAGAYYNLFIKLKNTYPNATIVSIIPFRSLIDLGYYDTFHEYMINICSKVGVQYIDLHNVGMESTDYLVSTDGTHPNARGMDLITNAIEKYVCMNTTIIETKTSGDTSKTPYYACPDNIEVKVGDTVLERGKGYTYTLSGDKSTANIKINGDYIKDNIYINSVAYAKSYSVTSKLTNCILSNTSNVTYKNEYNTVLRPLTNDYILPNSIDIKVANKTLENGRDYSYNNSNGNITIYSDSIIGDIVISANAILKADLAPKITVEYSNTEFTNKNVIVTIKSDGIIKEVQGWQLSNDKLVLTKEYYNNVKETINIEDTIGNIIKANIVINNIDKTAPTITSVTGNPTTSTKENVTLTINASDNLSGLATQAYSFDNGTTWQKENTKTYSENTSGIVIKVRDNLGNIATYSTINITKIIKPIGITIKTNPTKTTYYQGEKLDITGLKLSLNYDDNSSEEIKSGYTVTPTQLNEVGTQKIIVTYEGKTATFNVTVLKAIDTSVYIVENNTIKSVKAKTTLSEFKKNITIGGTTKILSKNGTELKDTDIITTGTKIQTTISDKTTTYTIVITGDTNGDGEIDLKDILAINKHRLNKAQLKEEYLTAGDVNGDGKVDFRDLLQINKYRLGKINSL